MVMDIIGEERGDSVIFRDICIHSCEQTYFFIRFFYVQFCRISDKWYL